MRGYYGDSKPIQTIFLASMLLVHSSTASSLRSHKNGLHGASIRNRIPQEASMNEIISNRMLWNFNFGFNRNDDTAPEDDEEALLIDQANDGDKFGSSHENARPNDYYDDKGTDVDEEKVGDDEFYNYYGHDDDEQKNDDDDDDDDDDEDDEDNDVSAEELDKDGRTGDNFNTEINDLGDGSDNGSDNDEGTDVNEKKVGDDYFYNYYGRDDDDEKDEGDDEDVDNDDVGEQFDKDGRTDDNFNNEINDLGDGSDNGVDNDYIANEINEIGDGTDNSGDNDYNDGTDGTDGTNNTDGFPTVTLSPTPQTAFSTLLPTKTPSSRPTITVGYPTKSPTKVPTKSPSSSPTVSPSVSPSAHIPTLERQKQAMKDEKEQIIEIVHDPTAEVMATLLAFLGIIGMLITAQQLFENPDGLCAGFCRLSLTAVSLCMRLCCIPCSLICGYKYKGYTGTDQSNKAVFMQAEEYTNDLELT